MSSWWPLRAIAYAGPGMLLGLGCGVDARNPGVALGDGLPDAATATVMPSRDLGDEHDAGYRVGSLLGDPQGECEPGSASCISSTERVQCNAEGVWSPSMQCQFACVDDTCVGECTPGATECLTEVSLRACSNAGAWSVSECNAACVGGACVGVCRPGESECVSATEVRVCGITGEWGQISACENACVGMGCTGVCIPGNSRCFSPTQLQSCSGQGQLQTPVVCSNACVDDSCGGECSPGSGRCNAQTGLPQRCSVLGEWENQAACPFVCTGNGSCTGECQPGERRCNVNSGLPQLCSNEGLWTNQSSCDFICSGSGVCSGECSTGEARCVGVRLETCTNFQWTLSRTCDSAAACDAENRTCCPDDDDPNTTLVRHPVQGCGQSRDFPNDPGAPWIEFSSGLHVDLETGTAWGRGAGPGTLEDKLATCRNLEFGGVRGWDLPTIDDIRAMSAGCANTGPGGACPLSHPNRLSTADGSGAACESCTGGPASSGPDDGLYCRPNAVFCSRGISQLLTRSVCTDCATQQTWSYLNINGNFLLQDPEDSGPAPCVRRSFPL